MPATAQHRWSSRRYIFSRRTPTACVSSNLLVIFRSATSTTPSLHSMPTAAPAFEMASMAYSTWYRRPSGLKMVVRESYLRAMALLPGYACVRVRACVRAAPPRSPPRAADELSA
jgi:hypothetical protein